jgi:hypothetical protein
MVLPLDAEAERVEDVVDTGDVVDEELVAEDVEFTASRVHLFQNSKRRGVASNELPLDREGQ